LIGLALVLLALPPAGLLLRMCLEADALGLPGAIAALWAIAAGLALLAAFVPGPRWAGGVALLVLSVVLIAGSLVARSDAQLNGVFGNSPIIAGRFYGVGNLGYA